MLHGSATQGRDAFAHMIKRVFERWQPQASHLEIAVTPNAAKAFVHWSAEGALVDEGGALERVWGLNMLVIDPQDERVQEAVGFRCACVGGGGRGGRRLSPPS